ncbi:hypothetical protein [uncultured Gammaproteobacteria bacterium]|nr:hypothetical protein [uncultured Gammaproteobacteria bacterium]CAC9639010.1 hypothetical protein [uncultured Gammaproteobacteria bacterium]
MNIFEKGDYRLVPHSFRTKGIFALEELTKFQSEFKSYDTDTTINEIRDSIVGNYLGYDLLNFNKHGFDAKSSQTNNFLEVKQCSVFSKRLGGTWNDTNEEKAKAFSNKKLFTAVGVWKGAADLQFMVYGQHKSLGKYLLERVQSVANTSTRSTQNIGIEKMIKDYQFKIIIPPDKTKEFVYKLLINYKNNVSNYLKITDLVSINEI